MFTTILAQAGESGGGNEFPPLHPILVNFTVALISTSLAADLLGRMLSRTSLRATGWWTLLLAACLTPVTAAFGWLWMNSMSDMDHWQMAYHKWLGIGITVALFFAVAWRAWIYREDGWPGMGYFLFFASLFVAVVAQAELGGSMTFGRGIFISGEQHSEHAQETAPATSTATQNLYTCAMHPEVVSDKPGKCPKCGMTLILRK